MTIKAPWSTEQVDALNKFQRNRLYHPFTCGSGNRGDYVHRKYAEKHNDRDNGLLIATHQGWVCPVCDYTQDWAHDWQFNLT